MQMSQVDAFCAAKREAHAGQVARPSGTGIEDECAVPCDYAKARASAQRVWQWRAGAAYKDMQPVRQLCTCVTTDIGLDGFPECHLGNLVLEDLKADQGRHGQRDDCDQTALDPLHVLFPHFVIVSSVAA